MQIKQLVTRQSAKGNSIYHIAPQSTAHPEFCKAHYLIHSTELRFCFIYLFQVTQITLMPILFSHGNTSIGVPVGSGWLQGGKRALHKYTKSQGYILIQFQRFIQKMEHSEVKTVLAHYWINSSTKAPPQIYSTWAKSCITWELSIMDLGGGN